ncbi:MAG: hypothetical protein WDN00_05355 [Limisphaerales bacterium]
MYAVGRLDTEGNLAKLTEVLKDEKVSVSREALKALLSKARMIPLADLEGLLSSSPTFHARHNALVLIQHTEKWKKIPALLCACADKDTRLAGLAERAVRNWFYTYNQSFSEPTQIDHERIENALSKVESILPKKAVFELRTCLKIISNEHHLS